MRGFLKNRPWSWVGTLYFAEAVPYFMVNVFFIVLLKRLGYSDATVTFWAGLISWPWVLKPLWAPLLDIFGTKRRWIITFQAVTAVMFAAAALAVWQAEPLYWLAGVFAIAAFGSSSHDIAADGFYIEGMSQEDQALYCGWRAAFYRIGNVSVQGGLLMLVGFLAQLFFEEEPRMSWSVGALVAAVVMVLLAFWHGISLPYPAADTAIPLRQERKKLLKDIFHELGHAFITFFRKPGVFRVIAFILLFRLAEAFLGAITQLFLLGERQSGGMGLTEAQLGSIYGTAGVICLIAGGIISGVVINRFGLGRCMLPMALALNVPDLGYVFLAAFQPDNFLVITVTVCIEQLGYGFGLTAFMLLMVSFAENSGRFKTSHFAFMTAFMALGITLPKMAAGALSDRMGYTAFFWFVMACTIPAIAVIRLVRPCYPGEFGKRRAGAVEN